MFRKEMKGELEGFLGCESRSTEENQFITVTGSHPALLPQHHGCALHPWAMSHLPHLPSMT